MTKKQFLELLLKSYDLIPFEVSSYRTSSADGQFAPGVGWKGSAYDHLRDEVIQFAEPDGFNMAVFEILKQAQQLGLKPTFVTPPL